jgi:hypothetical protein
MLWYLNFSPYFRIVAYENVTPDENLGCKIISYLLQMHDMSTLALAEFLKFVGPIRPRGQKIMRSANNVGPHVRQTFLNDVFTFLTEVGNAGHIVNTGTSSVNSEFVTALNTRYFICFW